MIVELLEKMINYEQPQVQQMALIYLEEIISEWMIQDDILSYLDTIFGTILIALKHSKSTLKHYKSIYQLLTSLIKHLTKSKSIKLYYYLDDILSILIDHWNQFIIKLKEQQQKSSFKRSFFFISSSSSLSIPSLSFASSSSNASSIETLSSESLSSPSSSVPFHIKKLKSNDNNNNDVVLKETFLFLFKCFNSIIDASPIKIQSYFGLIFNSLLKMTEDQVEQIHYHRHYNKMNLSSSSLMIQFINQSLYFMNNIIHSLGINAESLIESSKHELISLFSILILSSWSIDLKYIIYHFLGKCYMISTNFMDRTIDLFLPTMLSNFDVIVYHPRQSTNGLKKMLYILDIIINKKAKQLHQYGSDITHKLLSLLLDNNIRFRIRLAISTMVGKIIQHQQTILQPHIQDIIDSYLSLLKRIPKMKNTKQAYFTYKQIIRLIFIVMNYYYVFDILPLLYEIIHDFPSNHDQFSLFCSFYENLCLFKKSIGPQRWQELLIHMPPTTLVDLEKIHSLSPFCITI
ncbi:unnamed protein product [Cunninghamella blakesleeana]